MKKIILISILAIGMFSCCKLYDVRIGQIWSYTDDKDKTHFYHVTHVDGQEIEFYYGTKDEITGGKSVNTLSYFKQKRKLYIDSDGTVVNQCGCVSEDEIVSDEYQEKVETNTYDGVEF
jgi:hypothetical protein